MKTLRTVLGMASCLAIAGIALTVPTISSAQPVGTSYVACNSDGACWRVKRLYAYGEARPITYRNYDWYVAHRDDRNVRWLADPVDDRGYYDRDGVWHADPGARAVQGGVAGAGLGAAIGCIVTLPIGCAPGAAVGAAVGGGTGAVAGAASTPRN